MNRLSPELNNKLLSFNQKKLEQGEVFLLAKAIADTIPLAPIEVDSISLFTITQRSFINEVIYTFNDYSYIDTELCKLIYKLIDEISLWRYNIAYNPPHIFFKGDTNTVIDDLSSLLRYIDITYMCSVADVVNNANWLYTTFRELSNEVKLKFNTKE